MALRALNDTAGGRSMEYRYFGRTGMRLSVVGVGGLLARHEGRFGCPSPDEKRRIYLRAVELGINLLDMGYGDEVHIPQELRGGRDDLHFSLKMVPADAGELAPRVEGHLRNLRRDAIDILRLHHYAYLEMPGLAEAAARLKQSGKVRALCLIRHFRADQEAYAERGPEPEADADLVIYNYACRWQEAGLALSRQMGKGVLIMKALGGQWIGWDEMTTADWTTGDETKVLELAPSRESVEEHLGLIYPIVRGLWRELAAPGEGVPPTHRAVNWILENPAVGTVLVGVASVAELEEALGTCQKLEQAA
jgi:aryl-alcohol dehydrogenase-like predicted oxidoreductase